MHNIYIYREESDCHVSTPQLQASCALLDWEQSVGDRVEEHALAAVSLDLLDGRRRESVCLDLKQKEKKIII